MHRDENEEQVDAEGDDASGDARGDDDGAVRVRRRGVRAAYRSFVL